MDELLNWKYKKNKYYKLSLQRSQFLCREDFWPWGILIINIPRSILTVRQIKYFLHLTEQEYKKLKRHFGT